MRRAPSMKGRIPGPKERLTDDRLIGSAKWLSETRAIVASSLALG